MGVHLNHSVSYHPQTDGQTEVVNRCLETYLRCPCSENPKEWAAWLPLAEWWYNTTYQTTINMTPFQVVYGHSSGDHVPCLVGDSKVEAVNQSLSNREEIIQQLKHHLQRAQNRMKQMADKKRAEMSYAVGDRVFIKLKPYKQQYHCSNWRGSIQA
ncbi:hypothetical protein Dimus_039216 [Dionaea muscipula]